MFFFPIDTVKTRLQAKGGFWANGGTKGVYKGLGSAVVASAPGASLFFVTYDGTKRLLIPALRTKIDDSRVADGLSHMIAASAGEIAACTVRVPAEVVKQRTQAGLHKSSLEAFMSIMRNENSEGIRRGLYRGWGSTILREIPFTAIQFPLYEYLKTQLTSTNENIKGAICGSIAGGVAAAVTTPLDVIKTRLMLMKSRMSVVQVARCIYQEEGAGAFWRGVGPRTMWISAGGAIFLGVYEFSRIRISRFRQKDDQILE